jgi:hypothetical protein
LHRLMQTHRQAKAAHESNGQDGRWRLYKIRFSMVV